MSNMKIPNDFLQKLSEIRNTHMLTKGTTSRSPPYVAIHFLLLFAEIQA